MKSMHPRATHACDQCRCRKTKCSGEQPVCASCKSRGRVCQWTPHKSTANRRSRKSYDAGIRYQPRTHAPRAPELPHIAAPRPRYPCILLQDPSTTSSIAGTPPQSSHMGGRPAPAGWSALTQYEYDWQDFIDPRPSPPSSCPSSDVSSCKSVPSHTTPVTPTSQSPSYYSSEEVPKNTDNLESFLRELYQCIPSEWPSLPDDDFNRIENFYAY